ncbi:MAG: chorismate synthase [Mucispirillum sp.]|uniref:Chorismate synthase n=1 Tax=Candidatus Mucispirillum faecigallinarum TaxID=2838699 RepID=A0A9D2KCJ0_9BACT|nr:chorismate synthase [Mucispirillum sp.]HIZ89093.1 chorismate synthase [Candidatus Mucispirillum faecigallinarum]
MNSNSYGEFFKITTFGESHGAAVGVIIDGCPAGLEISEEDIQKELDRRKPGQSKVSTLRKEDDSVEILSGVFEGKTTGTPVALMVRNTSQRSQDYNDIKDLFRPGHADYTYFKKFGIRDYRGGGRASARETIGRVAAGAVAKKILALKGIDIFGYIIQIENIMAEKFDRDFIEQNPIRTADVDAYPLMEEAILKAKMEQDSVGGVIELCIKNVPAGLGEPVFDRLNARLAYAIMSIPAVKGVEFGAGFKAAAMRGSQNNDEITPDGFLSNNAGGTLGGISSGQDIILRFAVKPTSSILTPKKTIDIYGNPHEIVTKGRHDPCVAPRGVVVAEAMAALTIVDMMMINAGRQII